MLSKVSDGPQRRSVATLFTAQVKLQLAGRLQSLSEETEGAIAAQMEGIADRSLMTAQEASRGMRSTPPCALKTNSKSCSSPSRSRRRPTLRQPTGPTGAAFCPPLCNEAAGHSRHASSEPLSPRNAQFSSDKLYVGCRHATAYCYREAEEPSGQDMHMSTYNYLCHKTVCTLLYTSLQAKTHRYLYPRRNGPGSGRERQAPPRRTKPLPSGPALQASCASLACHSLPRRIAC
jgi:hypothetical protein